ncbi:hypothetical protein B0H63DRAFT_445584 [Podospora didyma]|uniref:Uncharacterized protein n=1 Tax=Podospora didyma TaxID=330526 RepID=A0AAE0NXE8_9PEZI|nr:hypothetical protein B0H63DRAFT_445584 [Podospora didyma]
MAHSTPFSSPVYLMFAGQKVVQVVVDGRLGAEADVSTKVKEEDIKIDGGDGLEIEIEYSKEYSEAPRDIIVQTGNYMNTRGVKRVLMEFASMGLVTPNMPNGGIVYKCKAYDQCDIGSDNEYDLKTHLYNSINAWPEVVHEIIMNRFASGGTSSQRHTYSANGIYPAYDNTHVALEFLGRSTKGGENMYDGGANIFFSRFDFMFAKGSHIAARC